tara:strand:- start:187 stop:795 length:609 start_codon:yes stop_codon:yes gene_type:complete
MLKYIVIFLLIFAGCADKIDKLVIMNSKKTYSELLDQYNSSIGSGYIDTEGVFNGKLSFSFKSQRDSTFFQFSDVLGRKTLLMWISPKSIIIRDLFNNKYYENDHIINLFPFLEILDTRDITEFIWGVEPDVKQKIKNINKNLDDDISLNFSYKKLNDGTYSLSSFEYVDNNLKDILNVEIKKRHRDTNYNNIRKFWKMLEY